MTRSTSRGHDRADPGHHRAVRVRLPVQLLLPGHPAPVRRGDGAHPRRVAGEPASCPSRRRLQDPGQAADRRGPGLHGRPGRSAHRRAPAAGRRRPTTPTCWAGCSPASTSRAGRGCPTSNILAQCITFLIAGHETTSGLLSFAIYFLMKNPEYAGPGHGPRSTRCSARTRRADVRAGPPADLRAAGPRRGAAAVADRAGVHPHAARGHRDRRPVRHPRRAPR